MKTPRLLILGFAAAVAVYLLAAFAFRQGYEAGEAHGRDDARVYVDWNGSRAQTKDAIRRWLRKSGPRAMEGTYPSLMVFPDKNCIQLKLEPGNLGGEPIYCYRPNTLQLMNEYSDVE